MQTAVIQQVSCCNKILKVGNGKTINLQVSVSQKSEDMKPKHIWGPYFNPRSQFLILQWHGWNKSLCKSFRQSFTPLWFQPSDNQCSPLIAFLHDYLCRVRRMLVFGRKAPDIVFWSGASIKEEKITQELSLMEKRYTL